MKTERNTPYITLVARDVYQTFLDKPFALSTEAGRLIRSWLLLLRWVLKCIWLTLRFGWLTVAFVGRFLRPVPEGANTREKDRATGLAIPALEMSLLIFAGLSVASHLW